MGVRTSAADYLLFWKLLSRNELDQPVCAVNTHSIRENIRGKSIETIQVVASAMKLHSVATM